LVIAGKSKKSSRSPTPVITVPPIRKPKISGEVLLKNSDAIKNEKNIATPPLEGTSHL
jgi:hypothetical protein